MSPGPLPVWAGLLTAQENACSTFWFGRTGMICCSIAKRRQPRPDQAAAIYRLRRPIKIERDDSLAVHWSPDGATASDPRLTELGLRWLAPARASGLRLARASPAARRLRRPRRTRRPPLAGMQRGRAQRRQLLQGCFVGQENTARMNWRQKVNRRLVVVEGDGGERARVAYPDLAWRLFMPADAFRNAIVPPGCSGAWRRPDRPSPSRFSGR